MSNSVILANIDSLRTAAENARKAWEAAVKSRDEAIAYRDEYKRQVDYHQTRIDNGDAAAINDLNNVKPQYDSWVGIVDARQSTVDSTKKTYDDALAALNAEIAKLTPAQQEVVSLNAQESLANANASASATAAELAKLELEAKDKTFAQSQAKILTYVGVGVVILVVGLIVYFSIFNKKRPTAA